CEKPLSEYYGISQIKWDRDGCGTDLNISEDGYTVSAPLNIIKHQNVRTNCLMRNGTHEFHVLIEKTCGCAWVGICGEGLDFSYFSGYQPHGWVWGSGGYYTHNSKSITDDVPAFIQDNVKIIVHLNMDSKTLAFSINGTKYPPVTSWTNFPSNLYFVASVNWPGKFRILSPED
ncbi:17327_t:CDS:1, partial [Acaulospora morrowiae]